MSVNQHNTHTERNSINEEHIYHLSPKQIETAISTSRKNHCTYSILMITLFFLANTSSYISLTSIPIFYYEPQYLCSDQFGSFTKQCSKSFICNDTHIRGYDYIDSPNNEDLRSFITGLNIYCNKPKTVFLSTCYFIGGLIGIILIPFLVSSIGCLNTIVLGYLVFFISSCFLSFITIYAMFVIMYILLNMSLSFLITCVPQYIIEMVDPTHRALFICLNFLSFGFSGYLSTLIAYKTKDYKYVIAASAAITLVIGVVIKFVLIDSVRTNFIQGKQKEIIRNLEYVAKMNKSQLEFKVWKDTQSQSQLKQYHNNISSSSTSNNKYNAVSFLSIFKYSSQNKLIILFSLVSFSVNYALLLVQLEITKHNKFFTALAWAFTCDIIGLVIGCFSAEISVLKRKYSFLSINIALIVTYFIAGISFNKQYTIMFIVHRVFVYALFGNYTLYNFEVYPTMTRPIGVSINRIFARVFNLWTPYLMISAPRWGYFLGVVFTGIIIAMIFLFELPETKNEVIKEFPREVEKDVIGKKNDDYINNEEDEDVLIKNDGEDDNEQNEFHEK